MTKQLTHYVGGAHRPGTSGRFADVYNPSTGQVQAQVPLASADEVRDVIANAAEAQAKWAATNPQKRARILHRFVDLVNQNADELAEMLSLEHGKTVADAHGDIQRGLDVVEFATAAPHLLKGEYSDSVGTGIDVYSMRQPLGVVAGITPFNFPAMIPLWKCGPAIAAGNAFVLKPSERDPSVPLRLAELWTEAGLPDGIFNVVNGDKEAVDTLLDDPRIKAVGFVGSTPIAQSIYEHAARTGKRAQCFGGAKNHLIIMPDADLDQAADALVEKLVERTKTLKVGHALDPEADFGPVVAASALERIEGYIAAGEKEGAELLVDGRGVKVEGHEGGYYVGATLFDKVTTDMSIYREEIFGPVLSVVRVDDFEEALALPTNHEFGNGVAIYTRDGDTAREFARRVDVGMVGVNVPIPVPIAYYTFGGWKASGFGDLNQHGPDAFRFYTKTKTVTSRWPSGIKEGASFVMPTGN